jgi:NADH-quinone oxidoreductase subunit C
MMGIVFKTHPDLRRILLPEESPDDYFPLRKDFPLGGEKDGWSSKKPKKC